MFDPTEYNIRNGGEKPVFDDVLGLSGSEVRVPVSGFKSGFPGGCRREIGNGGYLYDVGGRVFGRDDGPGGSGDTGNGPDLCERERKRSFRIDRRKEPAGV